MRRPIDHSRGALVMELVIVMPILILLIFGSLDITRFLAARGLLTAAAERTANYASINDDLSSSDTGKQAAALAEIEAMARKYARDFFPHGGEGSINELHDTIIVQPIGAECNDSIDNDGDGLVDFVAPDDSLEPDPTCVSENSLSESSAVPSSVEATVTPWEIVMTASYRPILGRLPGIGQVVPSVTYEARSVFLREQSRVSSEPVAVNCTGESTSQRPNLTCPCSDRSDISESIPDALLQQDPSDTGQCLCIPTTTGDPYDEDNPCKCFSENASFDAAVGRCVCTLQEEDCTALDKELDPDKCECTFGDCGEFGQKDDEGNCYCPSYLNSHGQQTRWCGDNRGMIFNQQTCNCEPCDDGEFLTLAYSKAGVGHNMGHNYSCSSCPPLGTNDGNHLRGDLIRQVGQDGTCDCVAPDGVGGVTTDPVAKSAYCLDQSTRDPDDNIIQGYTINDGWCTCNRCRAYGGSSGVGVGETNRPLPRNETLDYGDPTFNDCICDITDDDCHDAGMRFFASGCSCMECGDQETLNTATNLCMCNQNVTCRTVTCDPGGGGCSEVDSDPPPNYNCACPQGSTPIDGNGNPINPEG